MMLTEMAEEEERGGEGRRGEGRRGVVDCTDTSSLATPAAAAAAAADDEDDDDDDDDDVVEEAETASDVASDNAILDAAARATPLDTASK